MQCLSNGVQAGTTYIKARVPRDFYKHFGSDGLCSEKLRNKLKHTEPSTTDPDDDDEEVIDATASTKVKKTKQPKPTRKSQASPSLPHDLNTPSPPTSERQ
jgi:hypothetical protein